VNIPSGTQFGEKIVVQNEGFFYRGSSTQKGNHIISIKVTIPKILSPKEKEIYESIRKVDLLK
jgi:curved DNA-binding protein